MQHFYLITNESKDKDLKTTGELEKMLKENGGKVTTLFPKIPTASSSLAATGRSLKLPLIPWIWTSRFLA